MCKQVECVQALLEAGADKSAGAMDDMSALHFAAQQGHTEVVKALINAGERSVLEGSAEHGPPHHAYHTING